MENVLTTLNNIKNTNSRIDKRIILNNNKDCQLLKEILYFTFNPYIVTGISTKKINKFKKIEFEIQDNYINDIWTLMEYLKKHNTGRDIDIKRVVSFIRKHSNTELQDLYTQIVTKTLRIGVSAKTLNQIYGDLIPEFNVMLADKYYDKKNKVVNKEFVITQKLDGIRCIIIKDNNDIKIFSRQGQLIEGLKEIIKEAEYLQDNTVYDGELLLNCDMLQSKDLYRATIKEVRKDGIKHNVIFNVFDRLPLQDFQRGRSDMLYNERRELLSKDIEQNKFNCIKIVPILYKGTDINKIEEYLLQAESKNQEGVMINLVDSPYVCKRTDYILKVKTFKEADVKVVDVLEGSGRLKGVLGAITIEFIGGDNKIYRTNVGSGFSDEERKLFIKNPYMLLGKIITIKYFEITKNQQGGYGLRFPTWEGIIRDDKDEISMY